MLSTSISPVKISHLTDFNHIFNCQKMKLCTCQSSQKHILNKANQSIQGKFISECNKHKLEGKDILHPRNNYSFKFQPPLSPHLGVPISSTRNIESTDSQTDEVDGILEPQDSLTRPNSPNVVTISSCLRPLIDESLVLKDGFTICTPQNPWGQQVYIQLLALFGDLVAIHKVEGFGSHSASQFFSWCKTTQENIRAKTGVRWSELNRLPYCIPHMNIALRVLHNWLEGILPEHFYYRLGFQSIGQEEKQAVKDAMKKSKTAKIKDQLHEDEEESHLSKNSMYSSDSNDLKLGEGVGGGFMSTNEIKCFCDLLQTIVQPNGSLRLPHNLGSPSHGKFKAAPWLSIFTLVILLIIPEL
ncbi:hypothetical protein O181_066988 [Austropuccinia psidii MF-1]|uniref:Uncharacterized protein n=1 Tax=Austropuccinia psidii MF-1 TaxID=1389203 RepID=A0A9Q3I440_9BASI|nr:hypothetical protein [Austropuccinia psidii MF-1]